MNSKTTIVLSVTLIISACASGPRISPAIEDAQTAPIQRESDTDAPTDSELLPEATAAINSLLAAASKASESNNQDDAIAHLMRALRIAPRNAQLWVQLSAAHLADQNIPAATQHARKAIALAGEDVGLARSAWLQLANVYAAEGNISEAKAIRRRYRSIRG
jgi:tetratricopeptide (TPR) repeat protein